MTDPEHVIDATVDFFTQSSAESADLSAAFDAAAQSDPKVGEVHRALGERARADAVLGVKFLASLGAVPSPRPRAEIAVELWFLLRPKHYHDLVIEAGWTNKQFKAWLRRQLRRLLLEP
jgi:hypothetical protein